MILKVQSLLLFQTRTNQKIRKTQILNFRSKLKIKEKLQVLKKRGNWQKLTRLGWPEIKELLWMSWCWLKVVHMINSLIKTQHMTSHFTIRQLITNQFQRSKSLMQIRSRKKSCRKTPREMFMWLRSVDKYI